MTTPSSDVTFSQGGTGATTRTVEDKLRETCVSVKDFGAAGDGVTDDYDAFVAALAFLATKKLPSIGGGGEDNATYGSLPVLYVPLARYYVSDTIELKNGIADIEAVPGALIINPSDTHGLIVESDDTEGETTASSTTSAAFSTIRNLGFHGGGGTGLKHGIWLRGRAKLYNVSAVGYSGDGIHIEATAGGSGATRGNANNWYINQAVLTSNGRHGLYVSGADSNAGVAIAIDASANARFGIYDASFIGNTHVAHHCADNGIAALVSYNSRRYSARIGQESWCSANAPSGTTANNTGWLYAGEGGPITGLIPAWTSSMTVAAGGAYAAVNASAANTFVNCYSEGGQGPSQSSGTAMWLSGMMGTRIEGGAKLNGNNHAVQFGPFRSTVVNSSGDTIDWTWNDSQADNDSVYTFSHSQYAHDGYQGRFFAGSYFFPYAYAGSYATAPFAITTAGTSEQFGTGVNQPHKLTMSQVFLGLEAGRALTGSAAMPTSGTFAAGTFVHNQSPSVASGKVLVGWIRLTTGSSHVLNTDWAACYATTS